MNPRTALIAAELKRIHARSPEAVAVLMAPLIQAFEASGRERPAANSPANLAAMANSLAQIAAQAGDIETAVAIASLQAEIEAITAADLAPDTAPAAAPAAARAVNTLTLARRHLLSLVFGLLGAGAVSYAVYVTAQVRFPPGALLGWLLSASTTLLAVALTLRVGASLAVRMPSQRLTKISAAAAALACLVALGSVLLHRPVLDGAGLEAPTTPIAGATGGAPTSGQASSGPLDARADPGAPVATGESAGADPGADPGADQPPTISLWWLGDLAGRRPAATEIVDAGRLSAASEPSPPTGAAPQRSQARTNRPPPPARDEPVARYADLLNRRVLLEASDGDVYGGVLTGISKDGVTLATEVLMFSQPIQAERQFRHGAIRRIDAE